MGNCWAARFNTEIHRVSASGLNSKYVTRDGSGLSGSSSKVSAASLPLTPRSEDEILQLSNLKSFSFGELKSATRNFRPDSVLGEGGFGSVFKGWIDEHTFTATKPGIGIVIAVKRLNQEGFQGHKEWLGSLDHHHGSSYIWPITNMHQIWSIICILVEAWETIIPVAAEVNYLGQLYHPNLVKLIGYCLEDEQRLLVYEFMRRGSLENHLFRRASYFLALSWKLRMKVALGAAKGLAFLHSAEARVIYRDFKTSNVLLDSSYNAKLSDFGLAKDGPTGDKSHVSTRVMGTYGYAAPEYLATGRLTSKSDVYSFGVVLLEMLSGRRAVDKNRPTGEHNLVVWAKPYMSNKRKIFRVLDTRMEGQYSLAGALKVANLALKCLSPEPKFRPTMNEVVVVLEQLQSSKDIERNLQAGPNTKRQNLNDKGQYSQKRTLNENNSAKASYPRSSASPLHT